MEGKQIRTPERKWYDSSHASLCALGAYLQRRQFFEMFVMRHATPARGTVGRDPGVSSSRDEPAS